MIDLSEADAVELEHTPTTRQAIEEYFQQYIEQYMPFKEYNVYRAVIKFLLDYYYKELYDITPEKFKQLFEQQTISSDIYDYLLTSIGIPDIIIKKIPFSAKVIILKSFSDFQRYKSTIKFVYSLGSSFSERVSIYELFIDWDPTGEEVEGSPTGAWILKPIPVFKHPALTEDVSSILYSSAYNELPNLLVSTDQLTELKEQDRLVLPIKSNIILMDFNMASNVNSLYNIIIAILVKELRDEFLNIYFSDKSFSIEFFKMYYLWYYLLTKYYGSTWCIIPPDFMIKFSQDNSNPFTLEDIPQIMDKYQDLNSKEKFDNFMETYINTPFGTFFSNPKEVTANDMKNYISGLAPDIEKYIDNRITSSSDARYEIRLILNEMYNSFLLYFSIHPNESVRKYSEYLLNNLPQITYKPEETVTHLLLYNSKPYHCEILTKVASGVYCDDKLNGLFLDTEASFIFELFLSSSIDLWDEHWSEFFYKYRDMRITPIDHATFQFLYPFSEMKVLTDQFNIIFEYFRASVINLSEKQLMRFEKLIKTNLNILSFGSFKFQMFLEETIRNIKDAFILDMKLPKQSILSLSLNTKKNFQINKYNNLNIVNSKQINSFSNYSTNNLLVTEEKFKNDINKISSQINSEKFIDDINIKKKITNLSLIEGNNKELELNKNDKKILNDFFEIYLK